LERAAAAPSEPPDVDGPLRRKRWTRISIAASACLVVFLFAVLLVVRQGDRRRVVVATTPTTVASPTRATSHGATIAVLPGWHASDEPLNYWIGSPFELFSISTVPLPPSPPNKQNDAVCAAEIPNTVADNLPANGAYLWITLWRGLGGIYQPKPWVGTADAIEFPRNKYCELPNGLSLYSATLRRGAYDLSISYVLGPDAPLSSRAEMNQMLDSLDLSGAPPTNPAGAAVYP
jgi:hypothetical protein